MNKILSSLFSKLICFAMTLFVFIKASNYIKEISDMQIQSIHSIKENLMIVVKLENVVDANFDIVSIIFYVVVLLTTMFVLSNSRAYTVIDDTLDAEKNGVAIITLAGCALYLVYDKVKFNSILTLAVAVALVYVSGLIILIVMNLIKGKEWYDGIKKNRQERSLDKIIGEIASYDVSEDEMRQIKIKEREFKESRLKPIPKVEVEPDVDLTIDVDDLGDWE